MRLHDLALSGIALACMTLGAAAQDSGGAASGGVTSSSPAAPAEQPAPQQTYAAPPPPPPQVILGGWYAGLGGGWDSPNDLKFSDILGNSGTLQRKDGALFSGFIGYKLPGTNFRMEVEGGYAWHDISQIDLTSGPSAPATFSSSGRGNLGHVLVNAVYDIPLMPRLAFSLGAGAGVGFSDVSVNSPSAGVAGSASKTGFMWQGIGGLTYKMTPNLDLFADYRYRDAMTSQDVTLATATGPDIIHVHGMKENAVLVGFRWYLWSPAY